LLLLFLGVLNTAFAVTLYLRGLHLIKAQEAAVLAYFEPASAVVFGYLLLAQQPTLITIAGGLLILVAGVCCSLKSRAGDAQGLILLRNVDQRRDKPTVKNMVR